jgi:hypothetical protein
MSRRKRTCSTGGILQQVGTASTKIYLTSLVKVPSRIQLSSSYSPNYGISYFKYFDPNVVLLIINKGLQSNPMPHIFLKFSISFKRQSVVVIVSNRCPPNRRDGNFSYSYLCFPESSLKWHIILKWITFA